VSLLWIFAFYGAERCFELWLSRRNRKALVARGGQEYYPESFASMAWLHALFFVALLLESHPWRIPFDRLTLCSLVALMALMVLRYWCIASLGVFWNTRIVVLPGARVVRRGPYRFLKHPNYLVVTLELALLPLLMRAPLTLLFFSLANLAVLRRRIRLEELALQEHTDYRQAFDR